MDCVPEEYRNNKVTYIKDDLISKNCSRFLKVIVQFMIYYIIYWLLLQRSVIFS